MLRFSCGVPIEAVYPVLEREAPKRSQPFDSFAKNAALSHGLTCEAGLKPESSGNGAQRAIRSLLFPRLGLSDRKSIEDTFS